MTRLSKYIQSFSYAFQKYSVRTLTVMKNNASEELYRPLPPYLYNDARVYQLEREHIFAKNWIYAGRFDQLNRLGDYLSITIAGYPIFIYRSPLSNELIAFHNVCTHRAGPIVPMNSNNHGLPLYGNQAQLKCQYHSWLFDSRDGALKATPHFGFTFQGEQKKCLNLTKIQMEILAGQFIFIKLYNNEEKSSLDTNFYNLSNDIMSFPLHEYTHLEKQDHMLNCNWKTYVENYQEGYHIQTIHPQLNKLVEFKRYVVTNKNDKYSIHYAPSRSHDNDQERYLWIFVYPNLAINLYDKGYSIEQILPIGKDRTILAYDFFVRSSSNENEMKSRIEDAKQSIQRTLAITNEDKMICEQVQYNLDSGIYKPGYLSPSMENGVEVFEAQYRKQMKSTDLNLE